MQLSIATAKKAFGTVGMGSGCNDNMMQKGGCHESRHLCGNWDRSRGLRSATWVRWVQVEDRASLLRSHGMDHRVVGGEFRTAPRPSTPPQTSLPGMTRRQ
jgi:hypothetical protein